MKKTASTEVLLPAEVYHPLCSSRDGGKRAEIFGERGRPGYRIGSNS